MASMSTEIAVLRAILSLSRRRPSATLEELVARVREDAPEVQRALAALARAQLVQRTGDSTRLTMTGLAIAVATAAEAMAKARRAKTLTSTPRGRSARVIAMVPKTRRRRAAA